MNTETQLIYSSRSKNRCLPQHDPRIISSVSDSGPRQKGDSTQSVHHLPITHLKKSLSESLYLGDVRDGRIW